jgi:hypothetical protein
MQFENRVSCFYVSVDMIISEEKIQWSGDKLKHFTIHKVTPEEIA